MTQSFRLREHIRIRVLPDGAGGLVYNPASGVLLEVSAASTMLLRTLRDALPKALSLPEIASGPVPLNQDEVIAAVQTFVEEGVVERTAVS